MGDKAPAFRGGGLFITMNIEEEKNDGSNGIAAPADCFRQPTTEEICQVLRMQISCTEESDPDATWNEWVCHTLRAAMRRVEAVA